MSARTKVLEMLVVRVGFPFSETELSPALRKNVGEIEDLWQEYESYGSEVLKEERTKSNYGVALILLVGLGIIFLFLGVLSLGAIIVALPLLMLAYFIYDQLQKAGVKIRNVEAEESKLYAIIEKKVDLLSGRVFTELSAVHESRSRPAPLSGPSQVVKETIVKEVVMIPCSYCRGLMPQTSLYCPNCGAQRRG